MTYQSIMHVLPKMLVFQNAICRYSLEFWPKQNRGFSVGTKIGKCPP